MSIFLLRVLERIHGHLGWLAVAALLHPAIMLRRRKRRAPLSITLATLFASVAASLGALIYPQYRNHLKQALFVHTPKIGWLFERKEHLGLAAIVFAWAGLIAHLSTPRFPDEATRDAVARTAHYAFIAAFVLGAITGVLGIIVASHSTF